MWLITTVGFFSVVQKPLDREAGTLTVRARVRADLEALRATVLPELGEIEESTHTDYRYRATAPRAAVARAAARMVEQLDYTNFKDAVAQRQGAVRAARYHDVWAALLLLQRTGPISPPRKRPGARTPIEHPRPDDQGRAVVICEPSTPTPQRTWLNPQAKAVVLPSGKLPPALNGLALTVWTDAPTRVQGWEALAQRQQVAEPAFVVPPGLAPAAGAVVVEPDGRIWVVGPTNRFGGYRLTFPKGRTDGKTLQAAALAEVYEESGLKVRLMRHLVDVARSETYTRYYVAERVGGTPADMGWESQCVMLVPPQLLHGENLAAVDEQVLQALSGA